MPEIIECPKCKSQKVASGRLAVYMRSTPSPIEFVPGALKWYLFSLQAGAELNAEAFACPDCGMVWTSATSKESLREILSRFTKSE